MICEILVAWSTGGPRGMEMTFGLYGSRFEANCNLKLNGWIYSRRDKYWNAVDVNGREMMAFVRKVCAYPKRNLPRNHKS